MDNKPNPYNYHMDAQCTLYNRRKNRVSYTFHYPQCPTYFPHELHTIELVSQQNVQLEKKGISLHLIILRLY